MIEIDNAPWFVAVDVRQAIGLNTTTKALLNVNSVHVQDYRIPGSKGRLNKIVSEGGLYALVMRSTKPEAKAFQDWVTGTVLPSIRKD